MAEKIIAYRGSEKVGGRWFTTDREHAAYFGAVRRYEITAYSIIDVDGDTLGDGWDADAKLEQILEDSGATVARVSNWEGEGLVFLLGHEKYAEMIDAMGAKEPKIDEDEEEDWDAIMAEANAAAAEFNPYRED